VWFRSLPEALDLIEHYLARPEARARIAAAGREEVLRRHTWDARVAEMLALLADPHPAAGASASPADRA
jgi:spore maturation protein CgeB